MNPILLAILAALAIISYAIWRKWRSLKRAEFIRSFTLPAGLYTKLQKHHPDLGFKECQLVAKGLRQFFLAYLAGGLKPVSMPSQVVDDLWHEFILYTKHYQAFCQQAFGTFMHHTPAVVMGNDQSNNTGLRRCFYYACRDENINPNKPLSIPLLFAIDAKLNIPNGFRYVADCRNVRRDQSAAVGSAAVYCGGDFAMASGSGDGGEIGNGFGDITGDSGSGGDGGDGGGCGGGCSS